MNFLLKSLTPMPSTPTTILPLTIAVGLPTPFPTLPRFLLYRIIIIISSLTIALYYLIPTELKPTLNHLFIPTEDNQNHSEPYPGSPGPLPALASTGWIHLRSLPKTSLTTTRQRKPTQPERDLSAACATRWIAHGAPCDTTLSPTPLAKIDVLWTWVNGSLSNDGQPAYLFREHDELRYSLRSISKSIAPQLIRNLHLFTADISEPSTNRSRSGNRGVGRMGSVPNWLNLNKIGKGINVHHHSEAFKVSKKYLEAQGFAGDNRGATRWRQAVVPSRNSLAIESQIPHLDDLGDDLLYMNDDVFLLRDFAAGDLVTSLYGPVFRLQWDLKVSDRPPSKVFGVEKNGEWPSLGYSNWLLSNRFGRRSRRYLHHVSKMLPVESMREVSEIWADELSESASSTYRSQLPEVNLPFLTTWYHIEKQREAVLYSFLILKSDANSDGQLSPVELQTLFTTLALTEKDSESIVLSPSRLSSHPVTLHNTLGNESAPRQTVYCWVSSDGYPLQLDGTAEFPDYSSPHPSPLCKISLPKCFANLTSASSIFKRVTYEYPECGDCIIAKLVGLSGPSGGLRAALAKPGHWIFPGWLKFRGFLQEKVVKMVGDQKSWWEIQVFDAPRVQKRLAGVRLLQRYQYVLGSTPDTFRAVTSEIGARKFLEPLERPGNDIAMVTVNDLIEEKGAERVLGGWLRRMWPNALEFETN